jgi:hypothetical protein
MATPRRKRNWRKGYGDLLTNNPPSAEVLRVRALVERALLPTVLRIQMAHEEAKLEDLLVQLSLEQGD